MREWLLREWQRNRRQESHAAAQQSGSCEQTDSVRAREEPLRSIGRTTERLGG